jgi:hypothetical protein
MVMLADLPEKIESSKNECLKHFSEDLARNSFLYFFVTIFALGVKRVEGRFSYGEHLEEWAYRLQTGTRTCTISARFHLKSTTVIAYWAWLLYRMEDRYNEYLYLSYSEGMASYQTKRLKRIVEALPEYFGGYKDLTDSASICRYGKDGKEFLLEPEGILNFKRGRHPKGLICDDILRDPDNVMELSILQKVERIFVEQIEPMPRDFLHVVGTPQDREDLFYKLSQTGVYDVRFYPAVKDWDAKEVLWGEQYPFEKLMQYRRSMGEKSFLKEFQCEPVRSTECFITPAKLNRIVRNRLKNYPLVGDLRFKSRTVVAGFDIGKKTHPSHLCVLAEHQGKLVQIHSKFMDGWEYKDQIAYLTQAIEKFGIQRLKYDNTRAEFEGFQEQGILPAEMEGETFGSKNQFRMATELDAEITAENLQLLNDERQKRQLLSVDCDLKAPSNSEGHGDAFWSLALAVDAWKQSQGRMIWTLGE